MTMLSGNGPYGFGAGRPWPVERDAVARGGLGVVDDAAADARLDQRHALLGDALEVEPQRAGRRGSRPSSTIGHEVDADPLAGLDEAALLLDGQRREAEVAEHVEEVDDGVLLEDDRVVAGVDRRPRSRSRAPCPPPSRPIAAASMVVASTAADSA